MKGTLLSLAIFIVLAMANEDGVVYDAFQTGISSTYYMYQKYAVQDCTTVSVSQDIAVLEYNIDFSREVATSFKIEVGASYGPGIVTQIFLRLDTVTATPFSTVTVTDTGSTTTFINFTAPVSPSPSAAIHRVYFTFTSNAPDPILNLRNFQFFA